MLLSQIIPVLPPKLGVYWEPFLGSGALFFLLAPQRAVLGDACPELIATYRAVRDQPHAILRYLRLWKADREQYDTIRRCRSAGRIKRAAEFIYLNKMCWNGLYRVNSAGVFNVPFGLPRTSNVVSRDNLLECSRLLAGKEVALKGADFETVLDGVSSGDLVFLDPPYVTGHNNNGFVDYNEVLFSWEDQERLANVASNLVSRGAHVIVTNAAHDAVIGLYRDFEAIKLERPSTIAADPTKRRRVAEVILWKAGD